MCPACLGTLATVAMITTGAGSVSGLTALVVKKLRIHGNDRRVEAKRDAKAQAQAPESQEVSR